ncbi:MAG: F0F1 ATP synthase subunit delta [Patescibacteria group bacterium]|nr:F0F1 ATP synthase subunit delta [Patescibacteria group bacterium]
MNKKLLNQIVKKLFKNSFLGGKLDFLTIKGVVSVILSLPYPYSLKVLQEYKKQIAIYLRSKTLKVQSAIELSQKEIAEIEKTFKQRYCLEYTQNVIDESLIAGVIITAGDNVFDTSIKTQIRSLLKLA